MEPDWHLERPRTRKAAQEASSRAIEETVLTILDLSFEVFMYENENELESSAYKALLHLVLTSLSPSKPVAQDSSSRA